MKYFEAAAGVATVGIQRAIQFTGIEGMRRQVVNDGALVVIEFVSDEFKIHLRNRLAAFCYGAEKVASDIEYYSFENTVKEFLERYDLKSNSSKIGMAGELITHVLMPHTHPRLSSSAVFFNKEERNVKKGFDLTFFAADSQDIWYGEVKSGEVGDKQTSDEKLANLLKKAADDINDKLNGVVKRSRWDSAIIDAALTLKSEQARTVEALLRSDVTSMQKGGAYEKNVVLASTVIHDLNHCQVSNARLAEVAVYLNSENRFSSICFLVVQQHNIESIISYLREIVDNG